MKPITCMAIDDEPLALELLEDNISKVPFLKRVASCSNPLEAMALLNEQDVDLIFLDIQMPGLTGLQFIKSLTRKPLFILITAYEKYALEGYELDVVDYLVKPVAFERFLKAANKAREILHLKQQAIQPTLPIAPTAVQEFIFVPADYGLVKINLSDIQWLEGLKDYIKIHLASAPLKPLVIRNTLKSMEEELPSSQFLRIHKSYIVSKIAVTSIRKNSVFIGKMELPIGESYKEAIHQFGGKNL
jgi:DNA-binding LytR/AlgR family response regulator